MKELLYKWIYISNIIYYKRLECRPVVINKLSPRAIDLLALSTEIKRKSKENLRFAKQIATESARIGQ